MHINIYILGSNIQPHNNVLTVALELSSHILALCYLVGRLSLENASKDFLLFLKQTLEKHKNLLKKRLACVHDNRMMDGAERYGEDVNSFNDDKKIRNVKKIVK